MYILVDKTNVRNEEILNMYHETMPDGRLILPASDLRMLGSVSNCQIVASAKELKQLIKINAEEVAQNKIDEEQGETIETDILQPEGTDTSEDITEQLEETAESENKTDEPITEEE